MRIQHNIMAMSAYRNYNSNTSALAKNLEKLSSGYKINRAGDDAAGLAISEKMRAQITGLTAASKNVKDGISLVKTAEGAMQEIHDMLNRMDYLATQSANGTYDNEVDRLNLQKEVDALRSEINRIADSSNFNGINLLNGDQGGKSTSALGGATAQMISSVNGTPASKAGAAEITLKLSNNAATASTKLEYDKADSVDGTVPAAGTKAKIEMTMGAAGTTAQTITGTVDGTALAAAGVTEIDTTKLKTGDELTVGGNTYKMAGATNAAANEYANVADMKAAMAEDGFILNEGATGSITLAGRISDGATPANTLIAGTATVADVKDLEYTTGKKLGDLFDVYIGNNTTAANDGTTINAGDKITLVAKKAGALAGDVGTYVDTLKDGTGAAAAKYTEGVDEDFADAPADATVYEFEISLDKLRGGQKIIIGSGDDKKEITFKADDTASDADTGIVNLNDADVSASLKGALDAIFDTAGGNWDAATSTTAGNTFKYKVMGADGADVDDTNLGQVRLFDADGTEDDKVNSAFTKVKYTPAAAASANTPTLESHAKVQYTVDANKLATGTGDGNKITIGGMTLTVVADATDKDLANGKITAATDIPDALEQMGYTGGKVTVNGNKITIEDVAEGTTAASLAEGAGAVSFLNAADAPASEATVSGALDMKIKAGETSIADLKGAAMPDTADGDAVELKDLFDITVNGSAKGDDYKIQEGDEIKFTAKKNGQLSDAVMDKFKYTGKVDRLSSKNGYDEGSDASGDKTHYELAIDVTKVQGGASFTFGNVNGKSVTFDLSFDDKTTENNTVGAEDRDDLADSAGDRVNINLYGLNNADAQEKIFEQVKAKMDAAGFDVTRAISGNTVTLTLDAKKEGAEYNLGNIRFSSQNGAMSNAVYNPAGGNANGVPGTKAQVTYKFDVSQLQLGDQLTVGGTTITIGEETKKTVENGVVKHSVSLEDAQADPNEIVKVLESAGYQSGQVRFDTTKGEVTITGVKNGETAAQLAAAGGAINVSNANRSMSEGGLELQIGDTNDSFNRISVSIGDMHTKSMGTEGGKSIADISVATQDGAADAIRVIKDAINYVSSVRGDLGATQNRLEHTANNLSVMTENIQDAESTIRDTDIAEEMMAYTKNNILIQSAQAMLAQANAVPQGVLQLLG